MLEFISGSITMGFLVSGLLFLTFFKKTQDRFFINFSYAFWLLAIERIILALVTEMDEFRPFVYLLRLVAFLLIIAAVIHKNSSAHPKPEG